MPTNRRDGSGSPWSQKGRWLTPEDHGRVTVFLCSEAADALCGLAIDVDGGRLLGWMPWERYMAKRGGRCGRVDRRQEDKGPLPPPISLWSNPPSSSL